MTKRTTKAYREVFKYIENNIFQLKPTSFMTDFEKSMRNAIRNVYRKAKLHGCWFHYDRAIQRYCRNRPKLRRVLRSNVNARIILKQLLSLPLLPSDKFSEGYDAIRTKARKLRVFYPLIALFWYFNNFWIKQVSKTHFKQEILYFCCFFIN